MVDRWETRFETHPARTSMRLIVGIVVFVMLIGAGIWGVTVLTSSVRGAGNAYQQQQSAGNWIQAQKGFERDFKTYLTYRVQIADAQHALTAWQSGPHPADGIAAYTDGQHGQNLQTTLTGLQQQCQNTVTGYNTDSKSYLTQQFKDYGLPDQLDPTACSTS